MDCLQRLNSLGETNIARLIFSLAVTRRLGLHDEFEQYFYQYLYLGFRSHALAIVF